MNITFTLTQEDLQNPMIASTVKALMAINSGAAFSTPEVAKVATKEVEMVQKGAEKAPKQEETAQAPWEETPITVQELRARATDLAQSKGPAAVKTLLAKYEAASVTSLKEEHYKAFLADMEAAQ